MTDAEWDELAAQMTVDITTYGRKSGLPRRIEIWWFRVEGRFIITGTTGRRDWLANLRSDPRMIVHVSGRDIAARASEITDPGFRRTVLTQPATSWYQSEEDLNLLVSSAPMVELHFQ